MSRSTFYLASTLQSFLIIEFLLISQYNGQKIKKDLNSYTDADFEKLAQQWDSDEEELPEDELPPWKRPSKQQNLDLNKMNLNNPEDLIKNTKKGQHTMLFVSVSEQLGDADKTDITSIWQTGLLNAHIETQIYPVDQNRFIFMVLDGSKTWEVKEFLVKQKYCVKVVLDGQVFLGESNESEKSEL